MTKQEKDRLSEIELEISDTYKTMHKLRLERDRINGVNKKKTSIMHKVIDIVKSHGYKGADAKTVKKDLEEKYGVIKDSTYIGQYFKRLRIYGHIFSPGKSGDENLKPGPGNKYYHVDYNDLSNIKKALKMKDKHIGVVSVDKVIITPEGRVLTVDLKKNSLAKKVWITIMPIKTGHYLKHKDTDYEIVKIEKDYDEEYGRGFSSVVKLLVKKVEL